MRSHRIPPFCSACHRVEAWKDVQELVTLVGTQIANDRTIGPTFARRESARFRESWFSCELNSDH